MSFLTRFPVQATRSLSRANRSLLYNNMGNIQPLFTQFFNSGTMVGGVTRTIFTFNGAGRLNTLFYASITLELGFINTDLYLDGQLISADTTTSGGIANNGCVVYGALNNVVNPDNLDMFPEGIPFTRSLRLDLTTQFSKTNQLQFNIDITGLTS